MTILSGALVFFFFNDTATTEIYPLSLHDALPILKWSSTRRSSYACVVVRISAPTRAATASSSFNSRTRHERRSSPARSEEHTSELQSQSNLVCRLLLEKKKQTQTRTTIHDTARNA